MSGTLIKTKSSLKKSRGDYWLCIPKPGATLHGFSRVKLFGLIFPNEANGFQPPVQSAFFRRGNSRRATLMINEKSLLEYRQHMTVPGSNTSRNSVIGAP